MSFRNLGKLFKIKKKSERLDNQEIALPVEEFEQCVQLLLAYVGKDVAEFSFVEYCKCDTSVKTPVCYVGHGIAVLRYLGRSHNLSGADPFEDLEIDQIVDVFNDLVHKISISGKERDPNIGEEKMNYNELEALENLAKFDAIIATNGGHLALNKLTWADFLLAGMWDYIKDAVQIKDDRFPNIKTFVDKMMSVPTIKPL